MVGCACSEFFIIEPKTLRGSRASLQVARKIIEVASGEPLYVLIMNLSEKQVFVPLQMIIAHTVDRSQLVVQSKVTLVEPEPYTVAAFGIQTVG